MLRPKLPKGVSFNRNNGYGRQYRAQMKRNGIVIYLGVFDTPEEAKEVYDKAVAQFPNAWQVRRMQKADAAGRKVVGGKKNV